MRYLSSPILSLALLVLWSCSDMGDPVSCPVLDCAGTCNGSAIVDCAGVCGGTTTQQTCDECSSGIIDCAGECNGSVVVDCAGECNGSAIVDCVGTCNGSAIVDGDNCTNISYSTTIQTLFTTDGLCTSCHFHSVSFFSHINIMSVVNVGDSTNSTLITRLKGQDVTQMPKNKDPLEQPIITLIATWIQEGAQDN